jgi:O-methyltransferase domain
MRTHYHSNAVNDFNGDHIEREEIVENREETPTTILPETAILQMATGHYLSRALGFAAKHRIPDFLVDRPLHYREIAIKIAADPESLNRLLRLLAVAGVFNEGEGGEFSLGPLGPLLRSDSPGSMRPMALLFAGDFVHRCWSHLDYCISTGQSAFHEITPGARDFFASLETDPATAAIFDDAMAAVTAFLVAGVAAAYDFSQFGTIADIGGGNGELLINILQVHPSVRGILFDQSKPLEVARRKIEAADLGSRCQAVAGDFFVEVPAGADAYLLKHVIHDWNDDDAATILHNCRKAISDSRAKLLIIEGVYPARVDQSLESRNAAFNDLNMLVLTGGRQRSEVEFRSLLTKAGFSLTRIVPTMSTVRIIEGDVK